MVYLNVESVNTKIKFILDRLLIVFFFTILGIYGSREICDLDLWLHLKTGEIIFKSRAVPLFDIYSFTLGHKIWINHEWLFQLISYLFFSAAKADGLIIMQNLLLIFTFLTLFFIGFDRKNHMFVFVVLYLTLLTCAYRFTIRPDIFSLFFLALYLAILKSFTEKKTNYVWILPLLQIIWTNLHGFSFTGPLIVFIFLIGELIKRTLWLPATWKQTRRLNNPQFMKLSIILFLMAASSIVNPHGIEGAFYPFSVLGQISGEGKVVFKYIQELARPITFKTLFNTEYFIFYKIFILISLFSFRINRKHIDIADFILWAAFLAFSFIAVRNIAYFAIVATYCIFSNIHLAFKNKDVPLFQKLPKRMRNISYYAVLAVFFYFPAKGAAKYIESANFNFNTYELKSSMWGISELRYPKKAVDFLINHKLPKHIFNDFNSGAYIIGRAAPQRLVFIDGRTELYGPAFFNNYVALCEGKKDVLEKTLADYNIKGAFLTNGDNRLQISLLKYFFKNPQWEVVYFDENAIIFLRNCKETSELIKEFRVDLNNWMPPEPEFLKLGIAFRYPWPYVERGRILDILGCHRACAKEAEIALKIMPNNALALKYMSNYYFKEKDYEKAYEYARNSLIYDPHDIMLRTKLALIYHKLNDGEKATKLIDAIIKNSPKFAYAYYIKAEIAKDINIKEALQLLKKATDMAPTISQYHVLLGDLLEKEGDAAAAQNAYLKAMEYDSADKEVEKKYKKIEKN